MHIGYWMHKIFPVFATIHLKMKTVQDRQFNFCKFTCFRYDHSIFGSFLVDLVLFLVSSFEEATP